MSWLKLLEKSLENYDKIVDAVNDLKLKTKNYIENINNKQKHEIREKGKQILEKWYDSFFKLQKIFVDFIIISSKYNFDLKENTMQKFAKSLTKIEDKINKIKIIDFFSQK